MHVCVSDARTDRSDQLSEFARSDALHRRCCCHVSGGQGSSHRPRLRAGGCMTGRVRIERSLAQKDHDAAIHTLLGEMDVGLPDLSLEVGIPEGVRHRGAILTDFQSEPSPCPSGGRRNLFKPLQCRSEKFSAMLLPTTRRAWNKEPKHNEKNGWH